MAPDEARSGRCGHRVGVVGLGARHREDPAVAGHAEGAGPLGRAQDQPRRLLDRVVGVHHLGVRPGHPAVGGGAGADLLGRQPLLDPRVRVLCGHRREARPQLAEVDEVVVHRAAGPVAQRLLEQRVDLRRHVEVAGQLAGVVQLDLGRGEPGLGHRVVLGRPVDLIGRRARPGAPGLGAADQDDVRVAGGDVEAGAADQGLRLVAADRAERLVAGPGADPLGDEPGGVAVAPREHRQHAHGVGLREQPLGAPAVGRGAAQGLGHHLRRLDRGLAAVDAVGPLAGADQDGSARIERHRPSRDETADGHRGARPAGRL